MSVPILVIEDNEDLSLLFQLTLESAGYEVEALSNGKNILARLGEIRPSLVVMDIMMPEISGIEVARSIKQREDYTSLPILLVSALERLEDEQFHSSKADDILYKPFDLDDLLKRVDTLAQEAPWGKTTN